MRCVETGPARGSLRWIRHAVNETSAVLDGHIIQSSRLSAGNTINWLSPLSSDDYAEYRDESFLDLLGIRLEKTPLKAFWPRRGPQWDALARTSEGDVLLVEAKANIPEIVSPGTGASDASRKRIEESLEQTKSFLGVDPSIPWSGKLYQYANRLAHLYLLRELNDIPAWLVFVYFVGDPDTSGPNSEDEWKAALTVAKRVLGLGRNPMNKYVIEVFVDVRDLQ